MYIYRGKTYNHHSATWTAAKVPEAQACALAKAIVEELPSAASLKSGFLVNAMARLKDTGHENRLFSKFQAAGLVADIPDTYAELSPGFHHPYLSFRDTVQCLSDSGKMGMLLGDFTPTSFAFFWDRFKTIEPQHPVYTAHSGHLDRVVPLLCHCDEGTSQKKRPLMIIQCQAVLGRGTAKGGHGLNFVGNSIGTRFLFSVLRGKAYSGKNSNRLHQLIHCMASDLKSLFEEPITVHAWGEQVPLFFCLLGMKGDWPGLVKIGRIERHHLRDTAKGHGVGVCHLCKAGQIGHEWHRWSTSSMESMLHEVDPPWSTPGALTTLIPQSENSKACFYKIDLFHTMHKGLVGDLCSNAVVTWLVWA